MKIESKLELVLITYNREKLLEATLVKFTDSPFSKCKITVLNNCSTDNSLEIANSFLDKFSNLRVVENKFNIGANANIMRALEMTTSDYIWIICDDDFYDFSDCDDVIDCIINDKSELINVGAHTEDNWMFGGRFEKTQKLYDEGYPFFKASSFLPNNLFKRNAFLPYIISGYDNVINMYPHMPFLLSFYSQNKSIYIAKNRIVTARIGAQTYNKDEKLKDWVNCWLNTSILLKKNKDINKCFFDQWGRAPFLRVKISLLITFGCFIGSYFFKTAIRVFLYLSFVDKIFYVLLIIPYLLYKSTRSISSK